MSPHRQGDQGYRKLTVYSLAFAAYKLSDCYNDNIVIRHPSVGAPGYRLSK